MIDTVNNDVILIEDIIRRKRFHHVIQPIFNLETWKVFGYEALLRCEYYQNPELVFKDATNRNRLYELDTSSIFKAFTSEGTAHKRLFINIFPSTMINPSFISFIDNLKSQSVSNDKVIFEINESEKVSDMRLLRKIVTYLKKKGFSIALDDLGKGEASLKTVKELELDFVKLDPSFPKGLYSSLKKQNDIQMLLKICETNNIKLILEGIEDARDLAIAKMLGVNFGQGYLLGKPQAINELFSCEQKL